MKIGVASIAGILIMTVWSLAGNAQEAADEGRVCEEIKIFGLYAVSGDHLERFKINGFKVLGDRGHGLIEFFGKKKRESAVFFHGTDEGLLTYAHAANRNGPGRVIYAGAVVDNAQKYLNIEFRILSMVHSKDKGFVKLVGRYLEESIVLFVDVNADTGILSSSGKMGGCE